jgi:16S rRNA (guanine527-N7)-methyltransferase
MSLDKQALIDRLHQGFEDLDLSYGDAAIGNLVTYLELLCEWNKTHNLTAVDDLDTMLGVHVFDSASIKPYVKGSRLLDVGSGAGLPGLVLAMLSPALEVVSVEARGKKAQFQMYVCGQLKLKNVQVENSRVEEYQPKEKFGIVTARAFSSLEDLVEKSKHLIKPNGKWLAMKGVFPDDELKPIKTKMLSVDTFALKVPELDAERNLVVMQPKK